MVKDGWSQQPGTLTKAEKNSGQETTADATYSITNNHSKPMYESVNTQQQQNGGNSPGNVNNVWGFYESKEKLLEMHFC